MGTRAHRATQPGHGGGQRCFQHSSLDAWGCVATPYSPLCWSPRIFQGLGAGCHSSPWSPAALFAKALENENPSAHMTKKGHLLSRKNCPVVPSSLHLGFQVPSEVS
jgi:hypothetical protein